MTKRYTDEDVDRLVGEVSVVLDKMREGKVVGITSGRTFPLNHCQQELVKALAPFRPDPEEELIEAMARADFETWNDPESWDEQPKSLRKGYLKSARVVLSVVKERGLPQ